MLGWSCLIGDLGWFPGCWSFAADIVQRIFVVRLELGMLEFPRLGTSASMHTRYSHSSLTPEPYGEWPLSSLLCRTLWKSYLLSWRTKLAKLLCLKCLGRIDLVNLSFCAGSQPERLMGHHPLLAPRVLQSFHHHRPTARLESMTDPPAFLSCYQHDDDGIRDHCMKAGILVELSHLVKSEQVAILRVVDSRSNLQNRWSCLRSHRQDSAGRPYCRRSALDRLDWRWASNGRRGRCLDASLFLFPRHIEE